MNQGTRSFYQGTGRGSGRGSNAGRGNFGRGRGNTGRGNTSGRGNNRGSTSTIEMKFTTSVGRGHATYTQVKEHIVNFAQKNYKHGLDIAEALEKLEPFDIKEKEPTRKESTETKDEAKRKFEQEGYDMMYKAELQLHLERKKTLEENMAKAYALIFGTHCNKIIQTRIEEHVDYESKIKNNPIELLKAIGD